METEKIKLLYDLTAMQLQYQNKGNGGADYAEFMFFELVKSGFKGFHVIYNPNKYINPKALESCKELGVEVINVESVEDVKQVVASNRYEKFYSALPYDYHDFDFKDTQFIMVIHGLRTIEMPQDKFESQYSKSVIKFYSKKLKPLTVGHISSRKKKKFESLLRIKNKKVIVVSNFTKYSILNFFPFVDKDDIIVKYAPLDLNVEPYDDKDDFFLMVNADSWRKNVYRGIRAFDELFSQGYLSDKKVLVLGVGKAKRLMKVNNPDKFTFCDYVDRNTLENYFKKAFAFVYPTLNEGFGYPPLKAMRYKTPVLSSSISATSEVCGDSVLYFSPYSILDMKNKILNLSLDDEIYKELQERGIKRVGFIKSRIEESLKDYTKLLIS